MLGSIYCFELVFFLNIYSEMEFLDPLTIVLFEGLPYFFFYSGCTYLHSLQQCKGLHFLHILTNICHLPVSHLCIFFGEMSIQVFCQLSELFDFALILGCMRYLYILNITPWQLYHLQIFSSILEFVFSLVSGFLCCAKAFKFN